MNNDYRVVDGRLVELRTRTLICGNPDRPIPADGSVTAIGDKAFDWCDRITIFASPGSYAWKWAKANGIRVLEDKKTKQAIIAAKRTEREEKENIVAQRRAAGLCRHCGGEFKGLFIKKCISCGRAKDY